MRILAVNQFYAPDHSATAQLLTELCEDLVGHFGHQVTVLASRGGYQGGRWLPAHEERNGVRVRRVPAFSLGKGSKAKRLLDYGSFWGGALTAALREAKPDVLLTLTTPPLIGTAGALAAAAKGVPLVTWNQDIYPELAYELGVLSKAGVPYRALMEVARRTHRASRLAVALSPGMASRLEAQGCPAERIRVVANWADGRSVFPLGGGNPFREAQGWQDDFVVMYSGNLGAGHEYAEILAAARLARDMRMRFVFVGGGSKYEAARREAAGLTNVSFLPYQPKERLAESLSAADVHLVTLTPGLEGFLVPSKLYGILAAGKPVCFVGPERCEVARVVREESVGRVIAPGDGAGLFRALTALAEPGAAPSLGQHAREVFLTKFDRPVAVASFERVLQEAVAVP